MKDFYIYIVQVNIALLVFYLLYRLLFARDTFLAIRRLFLLTSVVLAFSYPLIPCISWLESRAPLQVVVVNYTEVLTAAVTVVAPVAEVSVWSWQNLLLLIWGTGSLILAGRMLFQLAAVCYLAIRSKHTYYRGQQVIVLTGESVPFSFFSWIFVDPERYDSKELEEIMIHEQTHVVQWHSLDMVLSELLCILFWMNPMVWFLRKEIRQNLEFLADKNVVLAGYDRKKYQYHLLRLSHQPTAVQIVNNFNVSSLKKRIIMMNKKRTSKIGLIKYALLVPVTGLLILSANAGAVAAITENTLHEWKDTQAVKWQTAEEKGKLVTGKVVDEAGQPVQGVSVVVRGQGVGTLTNQKGEFEIRVPEQSGLCFSYVGKQTETIWYGSLTKGMQIVMKKDNLLLDKVVVAAYAPDEKTENSSGDEELFVVVEDMPSFSSGNLLEYVARNIKYPVIAQENGIEGTVVVSFVVNEQGKVADIKVTKKVDASLDKEAMRIIQQMPDWKPGKQRGKPVAVQFSIPIEFHLASKAKNCEVQGTPMKATVARDNRIYVVNDKIMPADFDPKSISLNSVESLTTLTGENAVKLFGEKGKNGAIVIVTKH